MHTREAKRLHSGEVAWGGAAAVAPRPPRDSADVDDLPMATPPESAQASEFGTGYTRDLPRERLRRCGAEALGDHELLAIILGTGYRGCNVLEVAGAVLEAHPKEDLMGLSLAQLVRLKGVGQAKAAVLVASLELARRSLHKGLGVLPAVTCPAEIVPMLTEIKDQRKEHFLSFYLNARNQVIHRETISIGSLSASIVHPREVFQVAVHHSAASLILAHNHPSGDVTPSKEDLDLTRRLLQAGEIMGIDVLDHIILGPDDFLSLKEGGLM